MSGHEKQHRKAKERGEKSRTGVWNVGRGRISTTKVRVKEEKKGKKNGTNVFLRHKLEKKKVTEDKDRRSKLSKS